MAASPQCEDGFLLLAHELDAALSVAGFGLWESLVLRLVREQIYGIGRPRSAVLTPSEVAARIGGDRRHAHRAIESLIASGVLVRESQDTYRFVKDYTAWTKRGKPRLSPEAVRFAKESAPKRRSEASSRKMTHPVRPSSQVMTKPAPTTAAKVSRPSSQMMTAVISRDDKTALAPNRNVRDEEFKKDDDEPVSLRSPQPKPQPVDGPGRDHQLPARTDRVEAADPRPTSDAADELAAVLRRTCPEIADKLTPRLRSLAVAYPVDMIRQAIPEAFARDLKGGPDAAVSYLLTTLRQWQADPSARTRPAPKPVERPSKPAKPFPAKKQPGDYDPYAKPTAETLAVHKMLDEMVRMSRVPRA